MAKVLITNRAINQAFWEFLAAFHKATPFQGKVQAKIKNKIGDDKRKSGVILKYLIFIFVIKPDST